MKMIHRLLLWVGFVGVSCTGGDDETPTILQDDLRIAAQVNEYPEFGTVVATVNTELKGDLTYSLNSLSINDALALNQVTGTLTVFNTLAFDYEARAKITGKVLISNGLETEEWTFEVAIRNIDDIAYWLTNSKEVYEAANSGNWVPITENEYNQLAQRISGISKSGTTDILYEQGTNASAFETYENFTVSNDLSSIPENSFIFAFKYLASTDGLSGNKVKVSNGMVTEGYMDLGNALPLHNQGQRYFVLKGAPQSTTNSRGFLAVYSQNGVSYDTEGNALGTHFFGAEDTNTLENLVQGVCIYQGLSTPTKQWD